MRKRIATRGPTKPTNQPTKLVKEEKLVRFRRLKLDPLNRSFRKRKIKILSR